MSYLATYPSGRVVRMSEKGEDIASPPCARCGGPINGHGRNFKIVSNSQRQNARLVHITCPPIIPEELG